MDEPMFTEYVNRPDEFVVDTPQKASWAFRKIKCAEEERDRFVAYRMEEIKLAEQDAADTIARFRSMLHDFFESLPDEAIKTTPTGIRKYKHPDGELILTPGGIGYERDNAALLACCKEKHPEFIRTKEEPSWSDIKKFIKETGEILDGVTPVETPPTFKVTTL